MNYLLFNYNRLGKIIENITKESRIFLSGLLYDISKLLGLLIPIYHCVLSQ